VTGGLGFRIETIWAFVAVHGDGDEGVISAQMGDVHLPLICADTARVASLRPIAAEIAHRTGVPVQLARFTRRTDMDRIDP
jgi:hypothetical protein